jgi:hypothetical protein
LILTSLILTEDNTEKNFNHFLSIKDQIYENIEFILIDDGSADTSEKNVI